MRLDRVFSVAIAASAFAGCANLAPEPPEPQTNIPEAFPVVDNAQAPPVVDLYNWKEIVVDPTLRQLVEVALDQNRDLRVAAANVRGARAAANLSAANRLPVVAATGSLVQADTFDDPDPANFASLATFSESTSIGFGLASYELDFFGRLENQSESAYQSYVSSVEGQRAGQIAVISAVAQTWLALAADKELLSLAETTVELQSKSLELTTELFDAGVANEIAKRQASASVQSARAQAAQYRAQVRQDANALRLLVGATISAEVFEAASLSPLPVRLSRPVGQNSEILLKRPDILAAERSLLASSADIGAARAAYFPTITLTGNAGYVSADLGDLLDASSGGWSFGPSISLPIFDGGRRDAALEIARASQEAAIADYERAVQSAFRDVADALAVAQTIDERIAAYEGLVEDTGVTFELSEQRFKVGVDNYLSVLDAQRSNYAAQQQLIASQLVQALNIVDFYRALGAPPENDIETP